VITEEDEGVYHCIVTNDDGSIVSDNATITVYGECSVSLSYQWVYNIWIAETYKVIFISDT